MRLKKNVKLFFGFSLSIALSSFLLLKVSKYWHNISKIKKEQKNTEKEILKLRKEEEKLSGDLEKLKNPEYVARYLREKFLYSKDGEYIIRIPDENGE